MGGVIGALTTKTVFATGALLLASRLDMQRTPATIDPSLPVTTIAASLAQRVDGMSTARRHYVDIGSSTIRIPVVAIVGRVEPPMTIGADVLHETALLLDLKQMRLRVMDDSQVRRATRGRAPIVTSVRSDMCHAVTAIDARGKQIKAALLGSSVDRGSIKIMVDGAAMQAMPLPPGRCATSDVALDWSSFAGRNVLLDLGHNRLWIW